MRIDDGKTVSWRSRLRRHTATVLAATLATGGITAVALLGPASAAQAAAEAPRVIFSEDFENPAGSEARQTLTTYVGADGNTYTSDAYWADVNACNGMVISAETPYYLGFDQDGNPLPGSDCLAENRGYNDAFFRVQQLAEYIGQVNGSTDPKKNSVVAAYTEGGPTNGARWEDNIEFATERNIDLGGAPNRFVSFSVNAGAINCQAANPQLQFFLTSEGNEDQKLGDDAINPCQTPVAPGTTAVEGMTPDLPNNDSRPFRAGTFISDAALTPAGATSIGIVMRNLLFTNGGNDHAFDDIRILDVSPIIDKEFSTPAPGENTATMTIKIVNTSELGEKRGWELTDWLSDGLRVADTPNLSTTCTADVSTGSDAGRDTVTATNGVLDAGQESCTITVDVSPRDTVEGSTSFENGADNFRDPNSEDPYTGYPVGLTPREPAQVEFRSTPPSAGPDAVTTPQGTAVELHPAIAPGDAPVSSFAFLDADGNPVDTVTVPGEGTWSFSQNDDGEYIPVFTPEPGFTGEATQQRYRVTDDYGQTAESTLDVTVTAVTPEAEPDETEGPQGRPQTADVLANDKPGDDGVPLDPSTLTLLDADGNPTDTVTVPGQGVYTVEDGKLVFTPEPQFTGTADPVTYQVADENGTTTSSTYTPTVTPVAQPDETEGPQGKPQTADVLANDGAEGVELDPSTLTLIDADGNPTDTVTVPGQGTYTVEDGKLVFTPEPQFTGTADPVTYLVNDTEGNPVQSTYTPTVTPVTPVAEADTTEGPQGKPQAADVLANDKPGDDGVPLDPESLTLLDENGNPTETVTVPGQGVYTVEDGKIVFTPEPQFTGTADPVTYQVADENGTTTSSTYTPTVTPVAQPDETEGPQGVPQTADVLDNDGAEGVTLVPSTLTLIDQDGNSTNTVTVPGQGTYTVEDGKIVFTPEPQFTGTADPVTYQVEDTDGNPIQSTYTPTVTAVTPVAQPDVSSGVKGERQVADVLANDKPGDEQVPLDPESLTLLDENGNPTDTVTVPGQGVYTIEDGKIVFTPEPDFIGTADPVTYQVADVNGTTTTSTYTPTVTEKPAIVKDFDKTAPRGSVVVIDPVTEVPGLDPATVRIIDPSGEEVTRLVVPGEGVWEVDPGTGKVSFTPEAGFDGDPTPIQWVGIVDGDTRAGGTITIRYQDTSTALTTPTEPGTPGTGDGAGPGNPGAPGAHPGGVGELPRTGGELSGWLLLSGLVAAAAGVLMVARRRRHG